MGHDLAVVSMTRVRGRLQACARPATCTGPQTVEPVAMHSATEPARQPSSQPAGKPSMQPTASKPAVVIKPKQSIVQVRPRSGGVSKPAAKKKKGRSCALSPSRCKAGQPLHFPLSGSTALSLLCSSLLAGRVESLGAGTLLLLVGLNFLCALHGLALR